jgi:hypothetical protein
MHQQAEAINAYPLSWPPGWKRCKPGEARRSKYEVSLESAYEQLLQSLQRMGARDVVVSTNLPLRRDGLRPYMSNVSEPMDRGAAVYWVKDKAPRVMACDHWLTVRENVRAVGLTLEALRAIERAGATELLERAYTGFTALPASTRRHWSDILNLTREAALADIESAYRAAVKQLAHTHPDLGGDSEPWIALNTARDEARKERA